MNIQEIYSPEMLPYIRKPWRMMTKHEYKRYQQEEDFWIGEIREMVLKKYPNAPVKTGIAHVMIFKDHTGMLFTNVLKSYGVLVTFEEELIEDRQRVESRYSMIQKMNADLVRHLTGNAYFEYVIDYGDLKDTLQCIASFEEGVIQDILFYKEQDHCVIKSPIKGRLVVPCKLVYMNNHIVNKYDSCFLRCAYFEDVGSMNPILMKGEAEKQAYWLLQAARVYYEILHGSTPQYIQCMIDEAKRERPTDVAEGTSIPEPLLFTIPNIKQYV